MQRMTPRFLRIGGVGAIIAVATFSGVLLGGSRVAFAAAPNISSISPTSGPAGQQVQISGTDFVPGQTNAFFNSTAATASCSSTTFCLTNAPSGLSGTVTVTVQTPGGTSNGQSFTYSNPPPTLTGINPTGGPAGTTVTLTGTNFVPGSTNVFFGGSPVTGNCSSTSTCTATSPAGSGTVNVTVQTPSGTSTQTVTYNYAGSGSLTITGITPNPASAGTSVTISGTGFVPGGTTFTFGSTPSTSVNCTSTTSCTVVVPSGTGTVNVVASAGGQNSAAFGFTYASAATITSISPTTGPAGTTVTFTGTGFVVGTQSGFATFGSTNVGLNCTSTTSCTATAPQGSGTINVSVNFGGATSNTVPFVYSTGTLQLSAIGTVSGSVNSPVTFTASGTNLPGDTVFNWNFGDGGTATGQSVQHTYTSANNYTVTLTASSASTGQSGTATGTAAIGTSTNVTISGPSSITAGTSVSFTATPSTTPPSDAVYSWNFGDGGSGSGQSVSHVFSTGGTYFVQVHITSASNSSYNATGQLQVLVGGQAGATATYQPGWNLVGGPGGTTFVQADGPLYTFQAGDTNYESLPNNTGIVGGRGYWAYFTTTMTVSLNGTSGPALPLSVSIPAGQFVMVGNPSATQSVTVSGADAVDTFNTASNSYVAGSGSVTLSPGQGAWVYSNAGAVITIR